MADEIKRLNYFTGQFLDAQDFRAEQTYHKEMRWRGNRALYTAGIVVGLEVTKTADSKGIIVNSGTAIDDQGREMVILPVPTGAAPVARPLPTGLTGKVNVLIKYTEALTDSHSVGGYTGATRVTETAIVDIQAAGPAASQVVLATLQLDATGAITTVDLSAAQRSSMFVAGSIGVGTSAPITALDVVGVGMISDGSHYAAPNNRMQKGSLTIGSINTSFGGGANWNSNTAGLLLETAADTEIAVHDSGTRLASLLYYQGDSTNRLTLGRDMAWGTIPEIVIAGAVHAANSDIYFTKGDHNHTGFGNTAGFAAVENAANYDALMILGRAQAAVPGDAAATKRRVVRLWDFLEVNGNSKVTGGNLHVTGEAGVLNLEGSTHAYMQWYPKGLAAGRKAWIGFGDPNTDALTIRNDAGRMHIYGEEVLYLLNKSGVRIGKEWNGNGKLNVAGNFVAEADALVQGTLSVQGPLIATGIQAAGVAATNGMTTNNITITGGVNKLNVLEGDTSAYIRAHDLWLGHSTRRGSPGRALVDDTTMVRPSITGPEVQVSCLTVNYGSDWVAVKINGTVQTPSSRKLKDNVQTLSSEVATRIVSTLEPVSFSFKRDPVKSECLGFIAEDAPAEVASGDGDSIVVNHIVAALTKVVKDQQRLIEDLERRIARLESEAV